MSIATIKLLDGAEIPWLGWGNGSGKARENPVEMGKIALEAGIRHIDTAQGYGNEVETGQTISGVPNITGKDVFVTSKLSQEDGDTVKDPIKASEVRASVQESIKRLGSTPDLFLVHNPFVPAPGELVAVWKEFEKLKDEGVLKSIGVSNFRPQDLEAVLKEAKHKPVVNQIEFHPYVLTHLEPVLKIQSEHGILSEAFGPLSPLIRHPTGGPLKPILERIAKRLGPEVDAAAVLLLWTRAQGVPAVSASGNPDNIRRLAQVGRMGDVLTKEEIQEITETGKKIHFRAYDEHMTVDFPEPKLPKE